MDSVAVLAGVPNTELNNKVNNLEKENSELKKAIDGLRNLVISLQARVDTLESNSASKVETPKVSLNGLLVPISCTDYVGLLQTQMIKIFAVNCT